METIEERAQEYAHQYRRDAHDLKGERADAAFAAYCQGAEDEHKELTRWRDPKEELPDNNICVLIKATDGQQERIYLGSREDDIWMADGGYVFTTTPESVLGFDGVVVGWHPIHE